MKNDAILLIDAGNSNIKWKTCHSGSGLLSSDSYSYAYKRDNVSQRLEEYIQLNSSIRHALISNVAGDKVKCDLEQSLLARNNISISFVKTEQEYAGVQCAYERVENLGVDRWIGIIAAAELYLSDSVLCIAGCGTATTVDFLTPEKRHLGGMISSGAELIRMQLGQNTANIPSQEDCGETVLFSKNTASAVSSGAHYAVAGMINTAVTQAELQLGTNIQLLLTGGASESVMPLLVGQNIQDTELLMKGLAIMASKKL